MKRIYTILSIIVLIIIIGFIIISQTKSDEIKIGALLPLTGDGAMYGEWIKRGIDLVVEEENQILGKIPQNISIIYEDTQQSPEKGVNAFNKLVIADGVQSVIGALASSVTLAVAPLANSNKVVLLSPAASTPKLSHAGDYIFRNCASDIYEGEVMADYAINSLNLNSASILYINNDYGIGIKEVFKTKFIQNGGKINAEESFEQGANDLRTQLTKIKSKESDALYLIGYASELSVALIQIKELGIKRTILSSYEAENPKILEIAGIASEGLIYTAYDYDPNKDDRYVKEFVKKYRNKFDEDPNIVVALGYDSARILLTAISDSDTYTGEKIKEKLYTIQNFPGVTGITSFDKNGDVKKSIVLKIIKNNSFVYYE